MYERIEQLRLELNERLSRGESLNEVSPINIELDQLIHWELKKRYTCCFTGPRPQKFSFRFDETHPDCIKLKICLKEKILEAISNGYNHFICGGALGVDTWAAIELLELRKTYTHIKLEIAAPCFAHSQRWPEEYKKLYRKIEKSVDIVYYTSQRPYFNGCMMIRNKYMVDRSSLLIGVYSDRGGTGQTIRYAKRQSLRIEYL